MTEVDPAEHRVSRRRLLSAGAVAGAGALLPSAAEAQTVKHKTTAKKAPPAAGSTRKADVAIVGAGLAGLTTARQLVKAGRSVIVLEARKRVGGRTFSLPLGPGASDVANMGATFVGPTQYRILALMAELGIRKFPTYSTGKTIFYDNGQAKSFSGLIPPTDLVAVAELGVNTLPALDAMAKQVPPDAPYDAPHAREWDGMTAETWVNQNILSQKGRQLVALTVEGLVSAELRDLSMLYFLFYIRSAGSTNDLIARPGAGGAQDFRVAGGTQGIAIAMARALGKRVILGHPVRRIVQGGRGASVYADGLTVSARRIVVAIPPPLAARIDYSPALPALRDQLTQRMPMGSLIKTIAVYDRPFWREQGLSGYVNSLQGPVQICFDASPESGTPGVMLGFVDAAEARVLSGQPLAERRRQVLASYARYFGAPALTPRQYLDLPWDNEVYTRGCPVCVMPPGTITSYGSALRAPIGRIHWAGTETATVWNGYMDGAVQSGQRAAQEVLGSL
jgi:monoamine oxidase